MKKLYYSERKLWGECEQARPVVERLARAREVQWGTANGVWAEQLPNDPVQARTAEFVQRLEAEVDRLRTALLAVAAFSKHPHPAPCGQDACVLCLIESTATEALEFGASA